MYPAVNMFIRIGFLVWKIWQKVQSVWEIKEMKTELCITGVHKNDMVIY